MEKVTFCLLCHVSHECLPPYFVLWLYFELSRKKRFLLPQTNNWSNTAIILNHFQGSTHFQSSALSFSVICICLSIFLTYLLTDILFFICSFLCITSFHLFIAAVGLNQGNQVSKSSTSGLLKQNPRLFEMQ